MASKFKIPHTFTIVFAIVVACAALTWFVPGGEFERQTVVVDGATKDVVVADSYHAVDHQPQTWQIFTAFYEGFKKSANIIVFILMIGGAFWVLNTTNAVNVGIYSFLNFTNRLQKRKFFQKIGVNNLVIILIMLLFSSFGAIFGMSEETLAFVVIFVPLAISMGYDSVTGLLMCYVAAHVGFAGALFNPFTIGIAQGLSGLQPFSGMEYRFFCWILLTVIAITFTLIYAAKVKRNPQSSFMYEADAYWRNTAVQSTEQQTQKSGVAAWVVFGLVSLLLVYLSVRFPQTEITVGGGTHSMVLFPIIAFIYIALGAYATYRSVHGSVLMLLFLTIVILVVGVLGYGWYVGEIAGLFLAQCWADGTMQELDDIWLGVDEAKKVVDMSDLTGENGTIKVVTTSTDMPFSYIKDGKNVGYDIDLVVRFCRARGYALELGDVDFSGRIPAIQSGKYDFTTDMNVTPEREEQVLFSDPTSYGGIVLAVLSSDLAPKTFSGSSEPEFKTFEELSGKTISMLTGAPFEELISSKVKNVKEFTYYTSMADMMLGVRTGRTDAGFMNNVGALLAANREEDLAVFPISLGESSFGLGFRKGDERCAEWQKAYDQIPEAVKSALIDKWTGADESAKTVPEQTWPGLNGTVKVAACDALEPMSYVGENGALLGLDVETILLIAKELDVRVEFEAMDFPAVLASVGSGKADIGCGSIVITDERRESMDFVDYQPAYYVLIVRAKAAESAAPSFFESIRSSFEKTFIRENRWKLFLEGIGTTMLITVLSIIFGTALGFAVYMPCRNGNKFANRITRFFVWLVQGMPVVVLLMILYYIIFARSSVSGTVVAIAGFTLVFGSSVYGMLLSGVGAVPKGQTEAAYALGYGSISTFFRIILPQAIPHFLPAYKGEITALIKATAIVGYIAVQDLTKMGDIVRGRTYEAFFPLIAVAVIYFILAAILTFIVDKIEIGINPKRRKKEDVLKGVQTHD